MNKLIAVVGMCGSGKSVATDYLEKEKGYTKIYYGGVTYDLMRKQNIEITRDSERIFREELRKEHGKACYAKFCYEAIKEAYSKGNVVIDGLYSWSEYLYLQEKFNNEVILLCVVADKNLRYERLSKRVDLTHKNRSYNTEQAVQRDLAEIENSEKAPPIAYADYYIFNNSDIDTYIKRLNNIIDEINVKGND